MFSVSIWKAAFNVSFKGLSSRYFTVFSHVDLLFELSLISVVGSFDFISSGLDDSSICKLSENELACLQANDFLPALL